MREGRLWVLGGLGNSDSVMPLNDIGFLNVGNYYANNDYWYDDTSDGPVKASVILKDGSSFEAERAWVLVGPPKVSSGGALSHHFVRHRRGNLECKERRAEARSAAILYTTTSIRCWHDFSNIIGSMRQLIAAMALDRGKVDISLTQQGKSPKSALYQRRTIQRAQEEDFWQAKAARLAGRAGPEYS